MIFQISAKRQGQSKIILFSLFPFLNFLYYKNISMYQKKRRKHACKIRENVDRSEYKISLVVVVVLPLLCLVTF